MKLFLKILLIVLLIILVLWGVNYFFSPQDNKDAENIKDKNIVAVEKRNIIYERFISGTLHPKKQIFLIPKISGIIDKIFVEEGESIRLGDAVARIRLEPNPQTVEQAKKSLEIAEINLGITEKKYDRNKTLYDKGFLTSSDMEQTDREMKIAKKEVEFSTKNLEIIQNGYNKGSNEISNIVYSTIDGIVLKIPLKEGSFVTERNNFNNGTTIAEVAEMTTMLFKAKVSESDIKFLTLNQKFKLSVRALENKTFMVSLEKIAPKGIVENGIVKFEIEGKLENTSNNLLIRSGYTAIAKILLNQVNDVLSIDEKALVFDNTEDKVFVYVKTDNSVEKKEVKTGLSDGIFVEIIDGLSLGDKISLNPDKSKIEPENN